jgi:Na+/H+ antiporter NhaD/arsenite permease-like protein
MNGHRLLNEDDAVGDEIATGVAYDVVACIIFAIMSFVFFFPSNSLIPLDRRTAAAICGTLCYVTRAFLFPDRKMDVEGAVDFDVIILLAGIMAINYIIIHQKETKWVINYVQEKIKSDPKSGFWLVAWVAFLASPFLTNDGVCLLFVEPVLNAFELLKDDDTISETASDAGESMNLKLEKSDAFYFLIALACSTNIGSSLTYTGNPQNMIVSQDAIGVMPPYLFLFYMLLPALFSFFITILWIQRCWMRSRSAKTRGPSLFNKGAGNGHFSITGNPLNDSTHSTGSVELSGSRLMRNGASDAEVTVSLAYSPDVEQNAIALRKEKMTVQPMPTISDFDAKAPEEKGLLKKMQRIIVTPFPFAMLILMAIMIAMIFVDIMSIAGLVCVTAVIMVIILVLGNHWQGLPIFGGEPGQPPLTAQEKIENTNKFFDELFESIDYSLLIIFLGTFIVVENVDSTGLPRMMWKGIVGKTPFDTFSSVAGISFFVLTASQFLGNVAVIQLAKPNVEPLGDAEKRYAWAVLSFVATVGGNWTIIGSAANIIVAEKAARIDANAKIDFFKHYDVCFWVTLLCCIMGALMITGVVMIDNNIRESW